MLLLLLLLMMMMMVVVVVLLLKSVCVRACVCLAKEKKRFGNGWQDFLVESVNIEALRLTGTTDEHQKLPSVRSGASSSQLSVWGRSEYL
jgi:hypothetical protein